MMPNHVHLYNAYKGRKPKPGVPDQPVPRQFTFLRRQGLGVIESEFAETFFHHHVEVDFRVSPDRHAG